MTIIDIKHNLKAFQGYCNNLAFQQLPFAEAQAVTLLARELVPVQQANLRTELDRPRPFTQNAIRALGASKGLPIARVVVQDATEEYLAPYEFGGYNKLNSGTLLKPIGQALDQYGNIPDRKLAQLKGRSDVFIGPVKTKKGVVNGVWQRAKGEAGTKPVKAVTITKTGKVKVTRPKAYAPAQSGQRLKLLIKFADAHPARQNIHWFDTAQGFVDRRFKAVFGAALAKAMASAKP